MQITIEEFNAQNQHDLHRCDGTFVVDSKLVLHVNEGIPSFTVVPVSPYVKNYPHSEIELESYLAQSDKAIYLAYCDGQLAGQIILFPNWNGFAYIDDIMVDVAYRIHGVGRALIQQASMWAKARNLPGIMLETQDINVGACLFYQRCGFELGGYDRHLYRAMEAASDEISLYWYLIF